MANLGLGQVRDDARPEIPTAGDDLDGIRRFAPEGSTAYAADVVTGLLAEPLL